MDDKLRLVLLAVLISGIGWLLTSEYLNPKKDPREPPAAPTSIPYIGHIIGLMRNKFNYYVELSQKTGSPILTMQMPGQKMYIVNKLETIQSIQKLPKALSFLTISASFASKICGISPAAKEITMRNASQEDGEWGVVHDSHVAFASALAPGPGLDGMNRIMIQNIAASLDDLLKNGEKEKKIKLCAWIREAVTAATTNAVYGLHNPFKDPEVEQNFWTFEKNLMSLILSPFPSLSARKVVLARTNLAKKFLAYFQAGHKENSSILMKKRFDCYSKNGIALDDIALFEGAGAFAILGNTPPATYWTALFSLSTPGLLKDLRAEIDAVTATTTESGELVRRLDITDLKTKCPLLTSTFQESLRYRTLGTSVRRVEEDTLLEGKWMLKKGALIQMPSRVIHMDASIWGDDVESFNPRRFLKSAKGGKRPSPAAFRSFGGGSTLCPGRHFATNEVLAVVATMLVRFDVRPVDGEWAVPTTEKSVAAAILMEPDTDQEVVIKARNGFEGGRWVVGLRDSKDVFAVVDEDRTDA